MKQVLTVILFTISLSMAKAQGDYKTALGIRMGPSIPAIKSGISIKHFIGNNAIEGIISFGDAVGLCGLYEIHKPLANTNLKWFIGAGGYAAFNNSSSSIGAAGIVGLDYKFAGLPLNLSLDWKPELNLITKVGFEASTFGFTARFTFK